jgi:hypothetical protein
MISIKRLVSTDKLWLLYPTILDDLWLYRSVYNNDSHRRGTCLFEKNC